MLWRTRNNIQRHHDASIMVTANTQCQNETNTLWWTLVHSRKTPLTVTYAYTRTRKRTLWQRARKQAKFTICTRNLLPRFHFISERWFNVQRRTLDIEEECVVYRLELNCVGYLFCFFLTSPPPPPLPSPSVHSVHQQFSSMTNNLKTPTTSATTMTAPWIGWNDKIVGDERTTFKHLHSTHIFITPNSVSFSSFALYEIIIVIIIIFISLSHFSTKWVLDMYLKSSCIRFGFAVRNNQVQCIICAYLVFLLVEHVRMCALLMCCVDGYISFTVYIKDNK